MIGTRKKRGLLRVLCTLLCLLLLSTQALAAGSGSLTVHYDHSGVAFQIYRAAVSDGAGGYTLTGDFADYPVTLPGEGGSNSAWRAAASTLAGYVASQDPEPTAAGVTSGGRVTFSGLETGLYLVIGARSTSGNTVYTPIPVLVYVDGSVEVYGKADSDTEPDDPGPDDPGGGDSDTVTLRVRKEWDGGNPTDSVTIQLVRDGENDRQVTLNDGNDWTYTWNSTSGVQWQVVEVDVPGGFTVSVDREGWTFTVTNTYREPGEPGGPDEPGGPGEPGEPGEPGSPDQPGGPDEPGGPEEPDMPGTPDGPESPEEPGTSEEDKLPQTGQLWWPVLALAVCGGGLVLIGALRRRSGEGDRKA